jgi:HK97 family phage major capsid protein
MGYFVPTDFFKQVFSAIRAHDPLLSSDDVTIIQSTNGRPIQIPCVGDIESIAQVIGEAGNPSQDDIAVTGQVKLGAFSYRTPIYKCSVEAFDDMETGIPVMDLFQSFSASRIQRGMGRDFLTGSGSSKTLGLIGQLEGLGRGAIYATGDSANTGGAQTGANSIGSVDLANVFYSVNSAYRSSEKCAWLMADSTLQFLASIIDKQGRPVVSIVDGVEQILGKPVKVSPSMPGIGASNVTVIFGDLSYVVSRVVTEGEGIGIKVYRERFAETGEVGLQSFVRGDSVLAFTDANSDAPLAYLQQHS